MSFFERARVGYESLAGRADTAFDSATASKELGDIDQHYRDLGVLAYLSATGRPADGGAQERLLQALRAMEQRGAIRDFTLQTSEAPAGVPEAPERHGGSDGIPQPPPERAGRHGDFLTQSRPSPQTWAPSDPDETTGPRPTSTPGSTPPPPPPPIGGTWGPPPR